jgi:hypothetical protein
MAGSFGKRGSPPQSVQHVIGKEHFGLLEALGIAPDGPENVIPSQNDIDERLAKGRADLDRRIEVLHKNLAAQVGPAKRPCAMVRIRIENDRTNPARMVRGQFDRSRRLIPLLRFDHSVQVYR